MPLTAAERMARMRARQRTAGLTTLTLVVPVRDVNQFNRLAARRRKKLEAGDSFTPAPGHRMRAATARSIQPADIMQIRELLEVAAVSVVIQKMKPRISRRLRAVIADEAVLDGNASAADLQRFHLTLGELSGDPALLLFLRLALGLTNEHSTFERRSRADRDAVVGRLKLLHSTIATAIVNRSEGLAIRRMRRYLRGLVEWLE